LSLAGAPERCVPKPRANVSHANLTFANLSGANLSGAALVGTWLGAANLSRANLSGANLSGANLKFANLSGANLSGATLRRAKLDEANLQGATLDGADLRGTTLSLAGLEGASLESVVLIAANLHLADLSRAILSGDLTHANLSGANLSGATLDGAWLKSAGMEGANLEGANLEGASLRGAQLENAYLSDANLKDADLTEANVSNADLSYVHLPGAIYAPRSKPPNPYVVGIVGLSTLKAPPGHEIGLVQLLNLIENAGLPEGVREVTDSIQRAVTKDDLSSPFWTFDWVNGIGRFVAFDLTTAYGLQPTRALLMIVGLGGILTLVYVWPILKARKHPENAGSVYRIFPADRINRTSRGTMIEKDPKAVCVCAENWRGAFKQAAYFSLLSAVNIGFEQFTPGDWIRRMQNCDYTLEGVGWVRVVAGIQSVISVYLLAIWAITQFGRPFQ
jgi:uncharacterized protein YjbI with pentapeptide repeats